MTQFQKSAKLALAETFDKIQAKADGTVVVKQGYFYKHGQTPEGVANRAVRLLAAAKLTATPVEAYDEFRAWPKDSYFVAVLREG